MTVLGIDIGGSGIKGATVDVATGALTAQRLRVETPQPAEVAQVVAAVEQVVTHFGDTERVGITFPGVVVGGVTRTAANMDKSWIGTDAATLFSDAIGRPVTVLNDADAAGVAEMTYGAGKGRSGVTMMLTFGTGIGSALFIGDRLVPNTELGHLELRGKDAEHRASAAVREIEGLSWHAWAHRVQEYLQMVERLFSPELFIIGGGVSKKSEKWLPAIEIATPIVPAALQNEAGIVGAAQAALAAAPAPTPLRRPRRRWRFS
jgi:polyphosphate glucokinase